MIEFEKEVIEYLNLPSLPKREWDGKSTFQDGVAIIRLSLNRQAYAVCTFNNDTDKTPRIKKVFGVEPFSGIEKVFVVPSYMDNDTTDADLDNESKKRAEQLALEAKELENQGAADEAIENANKLPEWIFPEIQNLEQAQAYIKSYRKINHIKGKIPNNEETLKSCLYAIYKNIVKRNR